MKGYKFAVEWIALNDDSGNPDALNIDVVSQNLTVVLVADLFEKAVEKVADDVIKNRTRIEWEKRADRCAKNFGEALKLMRGNK